MTPTKPIVHIWYDDFNMVPPVADIFDVWGMEPIVQRRTAHDARRVVDELPRLREPLVITTTGMRDQDNLQHSDLMRQREDYGLTTLLYTDHLGFNSALIRPDMVFNLENLSHGPLFALAHHLVPPGLKSQTSPRVMEKVLFGMCQTQEQRKARFRQFQRKLVGSEGVFNIDFYTTLLNGYSDEIRRIYDELQAPRYRQGWRK